MDLQSISLTALVAIGVVNVITMFKPNLDSRIKFGLSALAAFGVAFIPAEIGVVILDRAKEAITAAFVASGTYKLVTKAGGQ